MLYIDPTINKKGNNILLSANFENFPPLNIFIILDKITSDRTKALY